MHMQGDGGEAVPVGALGSTWSQITVFVAAVDTSLGKWLSDGQGVGLTEYRALVHLAEAPDKELRVSDLAQRVGLNASSVTRLVSRLEAKALARRDVCPDDGRGIYAVITKQGLILVRELRGPYEDRVRELLESPPAHPPQLDAAQLARALRHVGDQVRPQ